MTRFNCLQCKTPVIDTRPPELYGDEINHLCTKCDGEIFAETYTPSPDPYIPCPEDLARQMTLDEILPGDDN